MLGELGIAGCIAFSLIILGAFQNTLEARGIARRLTVDDGLLPWRIVIAMAASYVLLLFMGWGFNFLFWHVWLWCGAFQISALNVLKAQARFSEANEAIELDPQSSTLEVPYA